MKTWVTEHPGQKWPLAFDRWYTQPAFCHYLSTELHLTYVGALTEDAQVLLKTGLERVDEFAARLKQEHLEALKNGNKAVFKKNTIEYKGQKEVYYSYCMTHHIHNFGKHRLVIDSALRDKLQRELKLKLEGSAAFWQRATQAQTLWCLALFINTGLTQGQNVQDMITPLLRAVCPAT